MKASTATRNVCLDKAHKLIRTWDATDAAVHDRQKLDDVLDVSNTGKEVWAASVYRSAQIEARLTAKGLQSRIHRRAARNPSAFTAPEVGQHDALESARPCRACLRPAAELDRRARSRAASASRGRGSRSG
jgi:IS5 family transposase